MEKTDLLNAVPKGDFTLQKAALALSGFSRDNEVTPECELYYEDGDSLETLYKNCNKSGGHPNFIPLSEFTIDHLPEGHRTKQNMECILSQSALTVKINVKLVSLKRPDKYSDWDSPYPYSHCKGSRRVRRFGTGRIETINKESIKGVSCPCRICEQPQNEAMTEFWPIIVVTATHVVYDDSEAAASIFDCFYDSDNESDNLRSFYGHSIVEYDKEIDKFSGDMCRVMCITHEKDLIDKLLPIADNYQRAVLPDFCNNLAVMVSHPHGLSKRISVGNVVHFTIPVGEEYPCNTPILFKEKTRCRTPLFPWSKYGIDDKGPNIGDEKTTEIGSEMQQRQDAEDQTCTSDINFSPLPGLEVELPLGTTFTLPQETNYALRFPSMKCESWFTLPPKTLFTLPGGSNFFLPPETEFLTDGISFRISYVTYDVASCPGSSGAGVLQDEGRSLFAAFPHSGSITMMLNRSGLQPYSIAPKYRTLSLPCPHNNLITSNILMRFWEK